MNVVMRRFSAVFLLALLHGGVATLFGASPEDPALRERALAAAQRATHYFRDQLAVRGGYVYYYDLALQRRWGEGPATPDQIWVQPPGTPTVGMAYLRMFHATRDDRYLAAATDAAEALIYGQLKSGGWTNSIDFNPTGRVALYRNGRGKGKNYSSLDDGQSSSAIQLLVRVDGAHQFQHAAVHEAAQYALRALLNAQFPNGAFPQVWKGPVAPHGTMPASYPDYDWRTEERVKNYWDMYTLNDNVCGYVAETLIDAQRIYQDDRYDAALRRLGDFLLLAQMPNPQPAWAQQYNYQMKPIWARKFEPPAIAADESQEVIETLIRIRQMTGDPKYLEPIPRALSYLQRSLLADGRLSRFYELQSNRPLYMFRHGDVYELTYDDSRLPGHYGWKIESRIDQLRHKYQKAKAGTFETMGESMPEVQLEREVAQVVEALDDQGRWVDTSTGQPLVGQPKFPHGFQYLASETFSRNLSLLADYLNATRGR